MIDKLSRSRLFSGALVVTLLLTTFALPLPARGLRQRAQEYDLVIKNARVVDGSGRRAFRADVAVKDGRIARVGRVRASEARQVVDARNRILAPGFIDVHAHVENIYRHPAAENFVRMGVTSLVTGNCGSSAVDVGKFLGRINEMPLAVNLATLIAHGSVRGEVLGPVNRQPTPEEMRRMEAIVEQGMKDGALGLSTGLIYVPGLYAKTDEVVALARVAARYNGLYATHMRNEGEGVFDAIRESLLIGERANIPIDISHFKISSKTLWGQSTRTLGMVRQAQRRGMRVTVDQYAYTASSTSLDTLLPGWALDGGRERAKERLNDAAVRERVVREMKGGLRRSGFTDYSYAVVAGHDANRAYNGKSIAALAREVRGRDDLDAQIDQIIDMFKAGGAGMVYHKMSERDVQRIMRAPFTMIASDSGVRTFGEGVPHPRGYGNNVRVLGRYVRELRLLTLEDAVRKMTSLPAQTFGLADRGLVREGYAADLVIFDEKTVGDRATYENPHQYPVGISHVLVNGEIVFADGRMTAARPGAALRRQKGTADER